MIKRKEGTPGPKILVIDGSSRTRDALRRFLEGRGYAVVLARDGHQGLALARTAKPHVVLLDVELPSISGFVVCQRLRGNPATEHIPVVVLAARATRRGRSYARTVGASGYLAKPVQATRLLATLDSALVPCERRPRAQNLGTWHVLALTKDARLVKGMRCAIDAHNFTHGAGTNYNVLDAPSLRDARRLIERNHLAAVVVDARAHNGDTGKIVRHFKTSRELKGLPVLVVGHERSAEPQLAWADGRLPGEPKGTKVATALMAIIAQRSAPAGQPDRTAV